MPQLSSNTMVDTAVYRIGRISAWATAALTVITFAIALFTPPLSGPLCQGPCFTYPFNEAASRYPRDYIWMFPAILLNLCFMVMMACIYSVTQVNKKLFSMLGLLFAAIAALILISDYFIQLSVVPVGLLKQETEGLALLSQYNPHGIFIVLEELGFLLMSLSFVCLAGSYSRTVRLENAIRLLLVWAFILAVGALAIISWMFGLEREYRFELAIISINWLGLIVFGCLQAKLFSQLERLRKEA